MPFSTTQAPGTFDIEGTLTHELGHAIGMDHAGPVTSTMFATAVRGSRRLRTLTEDDRAFVRETFAPPGGELVPWVPPDHQAAPALVLKLSEPARSWALELNQLWLQLGRRVSAHALQPPGRTTRLHTLQILGLLIQLQLQTALAIRRFRLRVAVGRWHLGTHL